MATRKFIALGAAVSLASTLFIGMSNEARAAVIIDVQEVGPAVVVTTTGSLDLTGLGLVGSNDFTAAFIAASTAEFGATLLDEVNIYVGVTGPISFGSGGGFLGAGGGDPFVLSGINGTVGVPLDYVSGAPLAATTSFGQHTFASLGLTPGTYVYNTPADTITVNIGTLTAPVPEPTTWAMMLLGFGFVGGVMRSAKRRQKMTISYA